MPSNNKEYIKKYMKYYVKNCKKETCSICLGTYKTMYRYKHLQTKKHLDFLKFSNNFKSI